MNEIVVVPLISKVSISTEEYVSLVNIYNITRGFFRYYGVDDEKCDKYLKDLSQQLFEHQLGEERGWNDD